MDTAFLRRVRGVTLPELLVVVSIIAFLAVLIIIAFRDQIFKGRDGRRKADIGRIKVAVEEYEKDHDCYPFPQYVVCDPGTGLTPYLSKVPCDPGTGASYFYEHEDSLCPRWYRIYASLENKEDPDKAKLGCTNGCGPGLAYDYYSSSPNAPSPQTGGGGTKDTGGGGAPPPPAQFYGCKGGVCVPIAWDDTRPGPECDPNYQNSACYNQCGMAGTECTPWQ